MGRDLGHWTPSNRSWIVFLLRAGCRRLRRLRRAPGPERVVVSGNVTYNGKPIAEGAIRFVPVASCRAPVAVATIVDGNYTVNVHGGVPVGRHKIEIEAYRRVMPPGLKPGDPLPPCFPPKGMRAQCLPKKFNVDTHLEITIRAGAGRLVQNFDLAD